MLVRVWEVQLVSEDSLKNIPVNIPFDTCIASTCLDWVNQNGRRGLHRPFPPPPTHTHIYLVLSTSEPGILAALMTANISSVAFIYCLHVTSIFTERDIRVRQPCKEAVSAQNLHKNAVYMFPS